MVSPALAARGIGSRFRPVHGSPHTVVGVAVGLRTRWTAASRSTLGAVAAVLMLGGALTATAPALALPGAALGTLVGLRRSRR